MPRSLSRAACCRILEIGEDASLEQIRHAHRRLQLIWHPDRFPAETELHAEALEKTKHINEAFATLMEGSWQSREGRGPESEASAPSHPSAPVCAPATFSAPEAGAPHAEGGGIIWFLVGLGVLAALIGATFVGIHARRNPETQIAPIASEPQVDSQSKPEAKPEGIRIDHAALVIFSPLPRSPEMVNQAFENAVSMFRHNAASIVGQLESINSRTLVVETHADVIHFGSLARVDRKTTIGYGYVIFNPPELPRVLEGVQPIDKVVALAKELSDLPPDDSSRVPQPKTEK